MHLAHRGSIVFKTRHGDLGGSVSCLGATRWTSSRSSLSGTTLRLPLIRTIQRPSLTHQLGVALWSSRRSSRMTHQLTPRVPSPLLPIWRSRLPLSCSRRPQPIANVHSQHFGNASLRRCTGPRMCCSTRNDSLGRLVRYQAVLRWTSQNRLTRTAPRAPRRTRTTHQSTPTVSTLPVPIRRPRLPLS